MKANELMFGDWVKHLNNPRRIKGAVDLTFAKDFEPIPLTAEILEKNNFSDISNISINRRMGLVYWYHVDRIGALEEPLITQDLNSGTYSLVYKDNQVHALRYVHELQHALRLFWLMDLADNFKV